MSYKTPPIPLLEACSERELMARFLFGTKRIKGLTTALVQTAGVKSKWLKPDEPRNIPAKRLLRIVLHTMHFLGREECKQRAILAIDHVFDHILPAYVENLADKQKQRPPCIRRLYRRRYNLCYLWSPIKIRVIREICGRKNCVSILNPYNPCNPLSII